MRRQLVDRGVYFIALTGYQYTVHTLTEPKDGVTHVLKPTNPAQGLPVAVVKDGLINGQAGLHADHMLDFTGRVLHE